MNIKDANKIAEDSLVKLEEALQQGKSEALTQYLKVISKLHKYSLRNLFLIFAQKPDATHVAGFQTWKSLGRFVKAGEKGITVIVPLSCKSKSREGEAKSNEDDETVIRFKAGYVFDVSQTDGEPFQDLAKAKGEPGEFLQKLKTFVAGEGIKLNYLPSLDGADGASLGGSIILREGLTQAEEFSVLVHELSHELLHRRDTERKTTKKVRELEAEAIAFVVSEAIGLETLSASSDYIQLYQGDTEGLKASLCFIRETASKIISELTLEYKI